MVLTARGRRLVQASEPLCRSLEQVLLEASDHAGATGAVRIGSGEIAAAVVDAGHFVVLGQGADRVQLLGILPGLVP